MPSRLLEQLAVELDGFRRARGLSQEAMAYRIGCSVPTYRSLERPRCHATRGSDPKLSTIVSVLKTIGLDERLLEALRVDIQSDETCSR